MNSTQELDSLKALAAKLVEDGADALIAHSRGFNEPLFEWFDRIATAAQEWARERGDEPDKTCVALTFLVVAVISAADDAPWEVH